MGPDRDPVRDRGAVDDAPLWRKGDMRTTILGQLPVADGAGRETAFAAGIVLFWALLAAVLLAPGVLRVDAYEGDTMHLAAAVLRMVQFGQVPHVDFSTPLGPLSFAPIAVFVAAGQGLGTAVILAQITLAAALLPVLVWIARTRAVPLWVAGGLALLVLSHAMTLTHGEADGALSIAMHYNRWGWAIGFPVLAVAIWPRRAEIPTAITDGVVIGVGIATLALIKVTYAVAFAPAVVLALALEGRWRSLSAALVAGAAVLAVTVAALGAGWALAYLLDLVAMTRPGARPTPGAEFAEMLGTPRMVCASLAGLAAAVLLRLRGAETAGLVVLGLVPCLVLVTWQNFGNEPQWLPFLALTLWAVAPMVRDAAPVRMLAAATLALGLPAALNVALAPTRHAALDPEPYVALLPGVPEGSGLEMREARVEEMRGLGEIDGFPVRRERDPVGRELPECELKHGIVAMQAGIGAALIDAGFGDRAALVTDVFSHLWMFGAGPPLSRGAPWQYAGLPGGADADLLVVPLCPSSTRHRTQMIEAVREAGWQTTEIHSDRYARVFEISRP